jgi:hypothetical protein
VEGCCGYELFGRAGSAARECVARAVVVLTERYIGTLRCATAAFQGGLFRALVAFVLK